MNDDLSLPLLYSGIAHLLLVLVFTVKAVFFPEPIDVYQPAIRVDIVDLPDKLPPAPVETKEEPRPPKEESPKEVVKEPVVEIKKPTVKEKEPEIVLNPKKEVKSDDKKISTSDAIDKIKKQSAIDKIKEEMRNQQRQELSDRVTKYKGDVLSPGTELTGVNKLQHETYLADLDHHVKKFWSLPEWLARGNYSAQVKVFIDEAGIVTKVQLVRSSRNSSYDEIVIETVKKAVPFPVPPEKFRALVSVNGVLLGFPE